VRHAVHPEADAEFADAVRYYSKIAPNLGVRFYRADGESVRATVNNAKVAKLSPF
jgi:hypothetical protein